LGEKLYFCKLIKLVNHYQPLKYLIPQAELGYMGVPEHSLGTRRRGPVAQAFSPVMPLAPSPKDLAE
jgi:hypothetical protein